MAIFLIFHVHLRQQNLGQQENANFPCNCSSQIYPSCNAMGLTGTVCTWLWQNLTTTPRKRNCGQTNYMLAIKT